MKILFLDIDGVVNCATTRQRHRGAIGIDPYMALLVGRIVIATGVEIVLSSTWRIWAGSRDEVRRCVHKFISCTPQLPSRIRGDEIEDWLVQEAPKFGKVEKYAILDDDSDMLPHQLPNFFQTKWKVGLTEEIAQRVIQHLNS